MKTIPLAKAVKPKRIITDREVDRFIRFLVALVRRKRLKRMLGVERCAAWAGLTHKGWRMVEHRRRWPSARTLARMIVAVNLQIEEFATALAARKIRHLRRNGTRNNCSSRQALAAG